jgi:hypothetical protein
MKNLAAGLSGLVLAAALAAPPAHADPQLKPGPHSFIGDVDLPEGTVQCAAIMCVEDGSANDIPQSEFWRYSAPYGDVVAFLHAQFATGRQYDAHGATWWKGLPPCYFAHYTPPPSGWSAVTSGGIPRILWVWSDDVTWLNIQINGPSDGRPGTMSISEGSDPKIASSNCYRS